MIVKEGLCQICNSDYAKFMKGTCGYKHNTLKGVAFMDEVCIRRDVITLDQNDREHSFIETFGYNICPNCYHLKIIPYIDNLIKESEDKSNV